MECSGLGMSPSQHYKPGQARTGVMYDTASFPNLPLAHGVGVSGDDRHVRGLCSCGASGAVDIRKWIAAGLGGQPLKGFQTRLSCTACGVEDVRLEVWYGPAEPDGVIVAT